MPPGGWPAVVGNQTAELTMNDGADSDELGLSVAISGNTVVAGAPFHTVAGNAERGAAYVFVMPAGGWPTVVGNQTAELTASDGIPGDQLGVSVAISGNTIVAGAPAHAGAAYVFVMQASGWSAREDQTAELIANDGVAGEDFGLSVATQGNTVVVGAHFHTVGNNLNQGAAYEFVMPAAGWSGLVGNQTAELTASDGLSNDILGASVAIAGDTIVAGAPNAADNRGAAYVFTRAAPSVAITSPANGAHYTQGQVVTAQFACEDQPDGSVLATCTGPVAPGAPIDTQALGPHSFTVTATDNAGASSSQTVHYTVIPAASIAIGTPILTNAHQSAKAWREGSVPAHATATKHKRPPLGTTFSFTLNQSARVSFSFYRQTTGRKANHRCAAQTKANREKRRCTRVITSGSLSFAGHSGANKLRFAGRLSRHRRLKPGRYKLQIVASNTAGRRSAPRSLSFTIVP